MEKVDFTKQFSNRLRDAMIKAGFYSKRSTSGVDIHKLAEITGHSSQICRKYLRGEAIPEPSKLVSIAEQLYVSPGWLLFGDDSNHPGLSEKNITISRHLLHYIFTLAANLYSGDADTSEIAHFLMELCHDISQLQTDEKQSKKIIDLTLTSVRRFRHGSN